ERLVESRFAGRRVGHGGSFSPLKPFVSLASGWAGPSAPCLICRELTLARVVDRLGQDARQLLRRVEPHGILSRDEIQAPLRLAVQGGRRFEIGFAGTSGLRADDGVE